MRSRVKARLEQQLWEQHQVVVPRQQMVQWVEHIAEWLRPIYEAMWQAMLATGSWFIGQLRLL